MRPTFFLICLCLPFLQLRAQLSNETFSAGLTIGATGSVNPLFKGSQISGLAPTIIPTVFVNSTYSTKEVHHFGFSSGLFFLKRFQNPYWLGVKIDAFGAQHYGEYDYSDVKGLTYQMGFKYWYGNIMPGMKIYPGLIASYGDEMWWTGFYLRFGLYAGLNLTARSIEYQHQPEDVYGESDNVKAELRSLITGKNDFGFTTGIGYEKELAEWGGLFSELRYCHGISDVVDVAQNNYGFRGDIINNIHSIQLSLGIAFYLNQ